MGKYRSTIEKGYRTYVEKYPDNQTVSVGNWDYPLQGAVLDETMSNVRIADSTGPLDRSCLIEYRDTVPAIGDLPMDDLAWLPVGLTRILKVQRTSDHNTVWTETAKILRHLNLDNRPFQDRLVQNFETLVRAVLCSSWQPSQTNSNNWDDSTNENHILQEASTMARYMAFPTLEGMLKSLMRRDVKMNGTVRPGRHVLTYPSNKENKTGSNEESNADEVNSVGYLLWHFEQNVALEPLKSRLIQYRKAVSDFFQEDEEEIYGFLSNQRNIALHGQIRARAEFGMLLNLLSLLVLNIDHIPTDRRHKP